MALPQVDKQELKKLKEKNAKLKVEVFDYQMRKRLLMWRLLLFLSIIVVVIGGRERNCRFGSEHVGDNVAMIRVMKKVGVWSCFSARQLFRSNCNVMQMNSKEKRSEE